MSFIMYKNVILFIFLLILSSCNKHLNVNPHNLNNNISFAYQEKPFEIKWKIEKKSITYIPIEVNKKVKNISKKHNRFV